MIDTQEAGPELQRMPANAPLELPPAPTSETGVVKAWTDKGGKVLVQSRAVPIKQVLVSSAMPAEEQERIRAALLGMAQGKPGKEALDAIGYKGFVATSPEVEASTIAWLGL